jgi:Icc-related predicted phosphoesterase
MRIVCISDTHSLHNDVEIPKADVLLHAGDFTGNGSASHVISFLRWFSSQPADIKICVAGNHDEYCEREPEIVKNLFKDHGVIYLKDEEYILPNNMKLYGTPFVPKFCNWSFMYPRAEMEEKVWSKVPYDTNILLTHGPARGILDSIEIFWGEDHVGCVAMLSKVKRLKDLRLCVFGHIHQSYGTKTMFKKPACTFVNASICTEDYEPLNKPIIVEI